MTCPAPGNPAAPAPATADTAGAAAAAAPPVTEAAPPAGHLCCPLSSRILEEIGSFKGQMEYLTMAILLKDPGALSETRKPQQDTAPLAPGIPCRCQIEKGCCSHLLFRNEMKKPRHVERKHKCSKRRCNISNESSRNARTVGRRLDERQKYLEEIKKKLHLPPDAKQRCFRCGQSNPYHHASSCKIPYSENVHRCQVNPSIYLYHEEEHCPHKQKWEGSITD